MKKSISKLNAGLLGGTLSLTISALIVKVIGVIYKIPLSYILGDEGMGYFNSAYTVYGFFYIICNSGIPKAVTLIVAENTDDSKKPFIRQLANRLLTIFGVLGIVIFIILIIFARPLTLVIGNQKSLLTLLAIAPSILFITLSGIIRGVLSGYSNFTHVAISQLIEALSKLVIGLMFAIIGNRLLLSVEIISALTVLGITVGSFFSVLYLYIVFKSSYIDNNTRQTTQFGVKNYVAKIIKKSIPITLSASVISLSGIVDLGIVMRGLIVSGHTPEQASALYGNFTTLTTPMLNLVASLLLPLSTALTPYLVSEFHKKYYGNFSALFSNTFYITISVCTPIALLFLLYPFDILDILYPTGASAIGAETLLLISPSMILLPLLNMCNTAIEAVGKVKSTLFSLLLGVVGKVAVTYITVNDPAYGINGAAIGTTASYLISIVISAIILSRNTPVKISFKKVLGIAMISIVSYILPYHLLYRNSLISNSFVAFFTFAIISSAIYAIFTYITIFHNFCAKKEHYAQKIKSAANDTV